MRQKIAKLFGGECRHDHTIVVDSVGVRRAVCEGCGHISFEMAQVSSLGAYPEAKSRELPKAAGL